MSRSAFSLKIIFIHLHSPISQFHLNFLKDKKNLYSINTFAPLTNPHKLNYHFERKSFQIVEEIIYSRLIDSKQSTYMVEKIRVRTPMLQFFSTRFARINLLTRAWFDREKGGCPFRIQYKTRRIHLSPLSLSLSLSPPTVSLSFPSFFVWVSRDDLRCSSTPTERKRESNVDRWRRCVLVAVAYFSLYVKSIRENPSLV